VGKPLRNGGSYFLRKRRGTKLERGGRLVNGTFVVSNLETFNCLSAETLHFSRDVDEQVSPRVVHPCAFSCKGWVFPTCKSLRF
jgi:hypothetical protein